MKDWLVAITLFGLAVAAGPCEGTAKPRGSLAGEGTIHQGVGPECGTTWAVVTADGRTLWPVNDPAFQKEGLKVRFTARERPDMSSICQAGTIVEFITLEQK
jgi:hypothetical protein